MFKKTATFYDALYHFKDYEEASEKLVTLIKQYRPEAKTLLDVGCGTGKHLSFLSRHLQAEGLDLDLGLLEVARKRCPDLTFYHGDMCQFQLDQQYDAVVCLFSSIGYVQTKENLSKAIQNMVNHLVSGGFLLIEPWLYPDQYWEKHLVANYADQPDLKIAWMYVQEREGDTSLFDIHYQVGTKDGIENFQEIHQMGLWSDQEYRDAFQKAGIEAHYDQKGLFGRGMYFGTKSK
ncbi:class I SAM-dependent methyltransferase [Pararhodonellum marinum]|uniref:class I SAM-dependent methyltransferase n=1 Tax=Pararhodonellum marinum TaxID=2755358 RepID=UPI00188F5CAA|nr:class I SAM-dependent methyltransferase [Pararhodonellum marinum]